jgi:Uncharacterized conserved protein
MAGLLQPQLMSVNDLFANSLFQVPDYQRAYAWEQKQWDDLWEDVREGMRTGTTHFLGTVVLMDQDDSRRDEEGRPLRVFDVVDGQQRLTTLCLLLLAVYGRVRTVNQPVSRGIWVDFVEHGDGLRKLQLGGLNREYFDSLLLAVARNDEWPSSHRSTDARLRGGVRRLGDLIDGWLQTEGPAASIVALASYVREDLQVLRYVTDSQALAIKMFQTVNDRGKELSLLDKTKSFLMFYLTRYLYEDADAFRTVEETFSRVFDNYDTARDLATTHHVDYLTRPQFRFNEDEFLRYAYHFGCNDLRTRFALRAGYEYGITPERIFDGFIKNACHELREQPAQLRDFILAWCADLRAVSDALVRLLERIEYTESHKRLFQFQRPAASVYPLLVAAEARGILDDQLLQAIAILDLRVYQVRGTDPKADLYRTAIAAMKKADRNTILRTILGYCRAFGSDQEINSILQGNVYRQGFAKYVLWNHAVAHDSEVKELDYPLFADCQMEHILPQDPSTFDVRTFGFTEAEDYESSKHGFGNLTPLEAALNGQALNVPPADKATVYAKSKLQANRLIGTRIRETGFRREHQIERSAAITQFFKEKWPIPPDGGYVSDLGQDLDDGS